MTFVSQVVKLKLSFVHLDLALKAKIAIETWPGELDPN